MQISLLVEGETEKIVLPDFFRRWLDSKGIKGVGFLTIRFKGCNDLWKEAAFVAIDTLSDKSSKVIGVISILDLASELPFPTHLTKPDAKAKWGKEYLEKQVGDPRYKHFFAHHELEAWLFSDPSIFPKEIVPIINSIKKKPEQINNDLPPSKRLTKIYRDTINQNYKKTVDGRNLFAKLDPAIAYEKCPSLQAILDQIHHIADQIAP